MLSQRVSSTYPYIATIPVAADRSALGRHPVGLLRVVAGQRCVFPPALLHGCLPPGGCHCAGDQTDAWARRWPLPSPSLCLLPAASDLWPGSPFGAL